MIIANIELTAASYVRRRRYLAKHKGRQLRSIEPFWRGLRASMPREYKNRSPRSAGGGNPEVSRKILPDRRSPIPQYWIQRLDQDWLRRGTSGRRLRRRRTLARAPAGKAQCNAKIIPRSG